jgi:imidazolonepropionase-like amidohydrolase
LEAVPYKYTSDLVDMFIGDRVTEEDCTKEYYLNYKLLRKQFPQILDNVARLHRAGAIIGFGTDIGGTDFGFFGLAYKELEHLVKAGMSKFEALQAATITNARILGLQNDLGSIEVGKLADLVLVEGNPLDDVGEVKNVKMVWKEGQIVYGEL